jgi:hypothetical protein
MIVRRTLLLCLLVVPLQMSCGRHELCDPDGAISSLLTENYEEWTQHFSGLEISPYNAITFEAYGGRLYTVRSLYRTTDGTPVISISTNEGYPRTPIGINGYLIYTSGEFDFEDDRYTITEMDGGIYCYERTS